MGCNETADAPGCSTRVSEAVLTNIKKGFHVLVEGSLISSTYEQANGKGKKAKAAKVAVFWSVRANSVRRLSRAETEIPAIPSAETTGESAEPPF
jgi:hypothetical protein